jgi:transcriptional regulator GlxA family with amidase domain
MTHCLHHYGEQWLSQPRMQLAMEEFLVAGLHTMFSDCGAMPGSGTALSATGQRALQKAIDYIHAHVHDRLSVMDLAAAACVSPRTLEVAFRRRYDQSPLSYVRGVQLDRVHETLRAARQARSPVQVTDVAMDNGFTHMGRFAGYYKQRFGHSPTVTLRGTDAKTSAGLYA